jgi:iron complex transport system permease protein
MLASALVGAILLLLADVAVQSLSGTTEMKLGVITALVGAPFFLLLILKSRNTLQ